MSVGLGTLQADDIEFQDVEVSSSDYDADWIRLEQVDPDEPDRIDCIAINRRQMQQLAAVMDRFLDK